MKHLFGNVFRFAGYSIAFFAIILLCFHFWFKYNSERTIEQLVSWSSNGKLKCSIESIQSDYFNNSVHIQGISIFTVDTSRQSTNFKFNVKDFHFRTRSRWSLFVEKQLLIDSIVFNNPEVVIRNRNSTQENLDQRLVLIEDLEKLYRSIQKSLNVLNLQLFKINEGKLVVQNEDEPSRQPLTINHIQFSINKLNIDSASVKDTTRFIYSERVVFRIKDQNLKLPDNKSNIAFKELLIDSKEKLVRFNGAAIHLYPTNGRKSSLDIKAKKLSMIGLDFNALYQKRLVKADSVYLEHPDAIANFFIGGNSKKNRINQKRALYDSTLNQLPVGFDVGHVVMQNGVASVNVHLGGKTTKLSANNDNINISGLRLNDSGKRQLSIGGFRYTLRNYNGFLRDSTLRFSFDSLQFINDKVVLHNLLASTPRNQRNRVIRDYAIPRLEITGMDWLSVIFQNNFKARQAVLYHPVVKVEKNDPLRTGFSEKSKKSIYQNLSLMDQIIDLEQLRIIGGDISLQQADTLELQLKNFDLNINIEKLGKARSPDELIGSLKQLTFGKATVLTPSVFVNTGQSGFYENGKKLVFDIVRVNTKNGDIDGAFRKVEVQDFSFENNQLDISNLSWQEGDVYIDTQNRNTETANKSDRTVWFFIKNMGGHNTWLTIAGNALTGKVFLKNISTNKISREYNSPLHADGFIVTGGDAKINLPTGVLQLGDFDIRDQANSLVQNILFRTQNQQDSTLLQIPSLSFVPHIEQSLLTKKLTLDSVSLNLPRMIVSADSTSAKSPKSLSLPGFNIHGFGINDAYLEIKKSAVATSVMHTSVRIKQIETLADTALLADKIIVKAGNIVSAKTNGFTANIHGNLAAELDHFRYHLPSSGWDLQMNKFETDHIDFKNKTPDKHIALSVDRLKVENLKGDHSDLDSAVSWFVNRSGAHVQFDSLRLQTKNSNLAMTQLRFDGKQQRAMVGSFALNPIESRSEFDDRLAYRKVYMTTKTQEIEVTGLAIQDESLHISNVTIDDGALNIYANKLKKTPLPFRQPLPVMALTKIGLPFQIGEIALHNAHVDYTEVSPVTKDTGRVHFSSVNARISNLSSRPQTSNDSLSTNISALFLDKIQLQLAMSQSYRDTLSGLRLDIKLGSGELTDLNPFLTPLISARVKSGHLDSMSMMAVGNEYISQGVMDLHYRDLKADLLDSGNVNRQKFRTKLKVFFANTVAIKNNSSNKKASFIFVRNRQKPAIVYFLRMVVGGLAGSIAPASNRLFKKQYKKSLQQVPDHARPVL
ncbi:MAG: DUF748 domain-containing protein [Dyadobacter sp.]|uniref:DUF748 domain-containing protein n=1 Tax=Dyadobacter sp. TaxID=1914288 RepID=UPI0032657A67